MAGTPCTSKKEPERPSEVPPTHWPMAGTSKKGRKTRLFPKKIRGLPDASIRFATFKVEKPEITPEDIPMSSQNESSPVDDSANHPTTSSWQSQDGSSSDKETAGENFDLATQFYTGHLPMPGLIMHEQSGPHPHTSIPSYPPVPDPEYQFGLQYPVGMLSWSDPTFCSQHSTSNCQAVHAVDEHAQLLETFRQPTPR